VGEAQSLQGLRRRRLPVIVGLTLLLLLLHLAQWGMERSAQGQIESIRTRWAALDEEQDQAAARLAAAHRVHPSRYLTGATLAGVDEQLAAARLALDRGTRARHPGEKSERAAVATAALNQARERIESVSRRLDRLDAARAGYAEAARRLEAETAAARQVIVALQSGGYRSDHFAPARALVEEAEAASASVQRLRQQAAGGQAPYLEIYEQSEAGRSRAAEATRLARGVEELRLRNEARVRDLLARIETARSQQNAARLAAARLALYTAYSPVVGEVRQANGQLDAALRAAQAAARANGMERQEFQEAADLLADGERQAGAAASSFARAIETERLLVAAVAAVVALRAAADHDLDDARRRINRYDHIDQERALRLYNSAAERYRRGETLRHLDPIAAAESYRQARSLAIQAERSVRTSEPSSGGGGGWGGGGGSGGPSGGSSGGPSGGSYGGPSGGSYGGGGF
jgi:hypothetical protein